MNNSLLMSLLLMATLSPHRAFGQSGASCLLSNTALQVFEQETLRIELATSATCGCGTEPRIAYENHRCLSAADRLSPSSCIVHHHVTAVRQALVLLNSLPTCDAIEWDANAQRAYLILSQDVPRVSVCPHGTRVFEKIRHTGNISDSQCNVDPAAVCPVVSTADVIAIGLSHSQREWISGSQAERLSWPTESVCNGAGDARNHCDVSTGRCVCHDDFTGRNCAKRKTSLCCTKNTASTDRTCSFRSVAQRRVTAEFRQQWCGSLDVDCRVNATDLNLNPSCDCSSDPRLQDDGVPPSVPVYTGTLCERSLCPPLPFASADPASQTRLSQAYINQHGQCNERPDLGQASGRCTAACISTEDGHQDSNPRCTPERAPVAITYYCKCNNVYPSFWLAETGCTVDIGPSNAGQNPEHNPDALAACGLAQDASVVGGSGWTPECNNRGYCQRSGVCKCFDSRLDPAAQCGASLCGACPGTFGTCNVVTGECVCHELYATPTAGATLPCRDNLCTKTGGTHADSFNCDCPELTFFSRSEGGCVFQSPIAADGVTPCGGNAAVRRAQRLAYNPLATQQQRTAAYLRGCECSRLGDRRIDPYDQVIDADEPDYGACRRRCGPGTNWNTIYQRCCEPNPDPSICSCAVGFRVPADDPDYDSTCNTPFCENGGVWTGSECDCSTTRGDDPELFGLFDQGDTCER